MNSVTRKATVMGCALGLFCSAAAAQPTPTMFLLITAKNGVPIDPPVTSVAAQAGEEIEIEVHAKCWTNTATPPSPTLGGYNFQIAYETYLSDTCAGDVLPVNFKTTTDINGACSNPPAAFGPPNPDAVFIDTTRPDWIFAGHPFALSGTNTADCNYRGFGAALTPPLPVGLCPNAHGTYAGTYKLKVSEDACGEFLICLDDSETGTPPTPVTKLVTGSSVLIRPLTLECATIAIQCDPPCLGDGDCDDGIACTTDTCEVETGCCLSTPDNESCDDGLFCNGVESCDTEVGCVSSGDPCAALDQVCDEANDECVDCLVNEDCDDGEDCTVDECLLGICLNDPLPNGTACDDGLFCTGTEGETCVDGVCQSPGDPCAPELVCDEDGDRCVECLTDTDCDDSNICTDDNCIANECFNLNNEAPCNDGLFCTDEDFCSEGACVGSGSPCAEGEVCDEENNRCVECVVDADCDDGNDCTDDFCGVDNTCVSLLSDDGTPCDDGLFCTAVDTCLEGVCMGSGSPCEEGQTCNEGTDTCGAGDCCLTLDSTDPPSGAIDARQNTTLDGLTPRGWDSVTFTFAEDASCVTAGLFSVTSTGGATPGIMSAVPNGNSVTVTLDSFIPVGHWTKVTYDCGDGNPTDTCLGFLPGDVTNDGTSSSVDIIRIVDCLNQVQQCTLYQGDANASNLVESSDILRVVDILNGAGALDSWNNVSLPANPCLD